MHCYYGANFHYWFLFPLMWGILIVLVVGFWRRRPWHGRERPVDIAKRRYAAGEITKEQLEQIKGDIQ
jgi:uncharacterized membrane protein